MNIIVLVLLLGTLTTSLFPMNLSLHTQAARPEADQTLLDAFIDNDTEMMKFALKELNAQVDMTNKDGVTLLEQAMKKSNLHMVGFLVASGAKITDKIKDLAEKDARLKDVLQMYVPQSPMNIPAPLPQENATDNNINNINSVNNVVVQPKISSNLGSSSEDNTIAAQECVNELYAMIQPEESQQRINNLVAGFLGSSANGDKKEQEEKKQAALPDSWLNFTSSEQEQAEQSLRLAAFRNDFSMVETALSLGADINASDTVGTTALMLAVHASPEMIATLIKKGAAVDKADFKGLTAFDYAARWFVSCPNATSWLLENKNISWQLEEILVTLVSYGANTYAKNYHTSKYEQAVQRGKKVYDAAKIEVQKLTVKNDALLRKTLIKETERRLQIEAMERIERAHRKKLDAKDAVLQSHQDARITANSDDNNRYGDRYAIHRRLRDLSYANDPQSTLHLIRLIQECGQDKNIFDVHPIFSLLEIGRIDVVEKLLHAHCFDIHTLYHERTILDFAIMFYSVPDDVIPMLLNYGARLNTHSRYFDHVLHYLKRRSFAIQELVLHQPTVPEKNKIKKEIMDAGNCRDVAQMIVDYC